MEITSAHGQDDTKNTKQLFNALSNENLSINNHSTKNTQKANINTIGV